MTANNGAPAATPKNMPLLIHRQPWLSFAFILSLSLAHSITFPAAHAATLTWLGDVNASWGAGTSGSETNWAGNMLPKNNDSLVFDLTTAGVANLSSTNDLTSLTLGGTNALTFTNDGGTGTGFTLTGNAITLGGNITSSGTTGTHTHSLSLGLILSGTRTLTAATGTTFVIDGTLSESGGSFGFIKAGAGSTTLSGSNSFTGAISVNQGALTIGSIANSGTNSAIGAGSVINLGSGTTTAGTLTYTGTGGSTNRTVNLAATTTGAATINSSGTGALIFTGAFANAGTGAKTLTLGGSNTNNNEIQSVLGNGSGTLSLAKSNGGTWLLSALNTYTGITTINQGTLVINSIADSGLNSAIGRGSVINIGSGTTTGGVLTYLGTGGGTTNRTVNLAATTSGGATINNNSVNGTGALIFTGTFSNAGTSGAKTLTLGGTNTDNNEIQSALGDGGNGGTLAVTKTAGGTWVLSGLNSYTGSTTINQGILSINSIADGGTSSAIGAGSVINFGSGAQTGTLFYSGAAARTNRTLNLASAGAGGATIYASGTGALLFTGSVTNMATTGTKILTLNGTTTGNDFQGVISDGGQGGVVAVTKADTGTWLLSGLNTFTGAVSINRASLTVNSIADSGTASALGAGTTLNLGSAAQTGTLIYTGTGGSTNRAIVLASTSTGGGTITNNGSGSLLLTGSFANTGTAAKIFTLNGTNTGANEIQGALLDSTSGVLSFVKTGMGAWTLSATSSFTGALSVNQGTLTITSLGAAGVSSAAGAGSVINLGSGTTVAGTLIYTGAAVTTDRAINLAATTAGAATLNSSGSGALIFTGVISNTGTGTKTLTLGGSYTGTNEVQSVIADGSGTLALAKADAGTWILSGANTYSGITTVNGGTLKLTGSGSIAPSSTLTINAGTFDVGGTAATVGGALTLGNATTTVAGQTSSLISSTSGGSFTLGGNVTYNAGSAGFENGQAVISANLVLNADRSIVVNDSPNAAVDVLVSGVISGSFGLAKGNGGTLRLSGTNTFTGQAQLNNGVTEIYALGNIGEAGALGTADKDATSGIIRFGSTTNTSALSYLGTGDSTNRRVQVGSGTGATATGGATILSNGSGALVFTATTLNSAVNVGVSGGSTARTLTLGGSNTSANTIQGAIVNNTGAGSSGTNAVSLVKQDAGVWILARASTYSGGTTVSGGTLVVNNVTGSATGTGSLTIANGGRLGGNGTAGSLTAGVALTQQAGGVIFAGQNGVQDAQTLTLQAAAGFTLSGSIELDLIGGAASGTLNAPGGSNDLLVLSGGSVTLSGATLGIHSALPLTDGAWVQGSSWNLIDWSSVSGTFETVTGLPDLSTLGLAWDWSQFYSSGTLSVIAAPEPSRALLIMSGLFWLLFRRRRFLA